METALNDKVVRDKFSSTFVTANYLKISDSGYRDFLLKMPIYPSEKKNGLIVKGEYIKSEGFNNFEYSGIEYEIYMTNGKLQVGDVGDYRYIPLPSKEDEIVKNLLINSINNQLKVGAFGVIQGPEFDELISTLADNSRISGSVLEEPDIMKSLIRLYKTQIFIRKKGLVRWFPLPGIVMIVFQPLSMSLYINLGSYQ